MLFESIKAGDRLEIQIKREMGRGKSYVSQVEEILPSNQIIIHTPIAYGEVVKLPPDEEYMVLFFTEKGMISFEAAIIKNMMEEGFNLITIKILSQGERMQRREFFRFNCILPFKFGIVDKMKVNTGNVKDLTSNVKLEGIIKDIGGGGIRFVSNEEIDENADICCIILLDKDILLPVGTVLHKQYFPKSNYKYQYRVRFLGIMQHEQEKIVQFIFNEQRKIIRKTRD